MHYSLPHRGAFLAGKSMKKMQKNRIIIIMFMVMLLWASCSKNKQDTFKPRPDFEAAVWPIFRGDAALSGIAQDQVPDNLALWWSFNTEAYLISSPVIGWGRVYIGSTNGKVYAIGLADGHQQWEFDTGDDIEASPLLLKDSIYIGSLSGDFFSLEARTGKIQWKYQTDNSIYGSANWVEIPGNQAQWILVGSYDNRIHCIDAASGKLNWSFETDNYINGAPATDGQNVVFGGCDENLYIVSVLDGTEKGRVWSGSYIPASAALLDNRAYLGHYDNKLVCIDIIENKIVWEYEDKENGGPFFSSPAVGPAQVLIGSRDGHLHCVDRETGQKIWTFRTRDEIDSSPVIAGHKVIIGSIDGRLYIVDLETGKEIWSYEIGAAIIGCPAVAGGLIIVGAEDGRIYAFGEDS